MATRIAFVSSLILVLALPLIVGAQSSPTYSVQGGFIDSSALDDAASATYRLRGGLIPYTAGRSGSNYYSLLVGPNAYSSFCGNGVRDAGEVCDNTDQNGQTCITQGYTGGTLACNATCGAFNLAGCASGGGGGGGGAAPELSPSVPVFDSSLTNNMIVYKDSLILNGTRTASAIIKVNGSDAGVTYPLAATWMKTVALAYGENVFSVIATNSAGASNAAKLTVIYRKMGDVLGLGASVKIGFQHLSALLGNWGKSGSTDLNRDGVTNIFDLSLLLANWGK